jgi:hypothetical protein
VQIGRAVHRDLDSGSQRISDGSRNEETVFANEITSIAKEFRLLLQQILRGAIIAAYLREIMHFPRARARASLLNA